MNTQYAIETASGRYVDLQDPDPATIVLEDIAHHLAHINRFAGAARRPISVAEHTLLVADRLRTMGASRAQILAGLHHDDHEAYTGDVTRPQKLLRLPVGNDYDGPMEWRVQDACRIALGLADPDELFGPEGRSSTDGCDLSLHEADAWALAAEAHHLMPSQGRGWPVCRLYDPEDATNPPAEHFLRTPWRLPDDVRALWIGTHEALAGGPA
jgi:uncharacterized protein